VRGDGDEARRGQHFGVRAHASAWQARHGDLARPASATSPTCATVIDCSRLPSGASGFDCISAHVTSCFDELTERTRHASLASRGEEIDLAMAKSTSSGRAMPAAGRCGRYGIARSPVMPINVSGPETVSICALVLALGRCFGRKPVFRGDENPTAWIADTAKAARLFGYPSVSLDQMVAWVSDWQSRGMTSWG
jgi:hypothetical protein